MEFRDKLLSSEIRHVTELVNMLSYELVILQDFLKEEFGSRYSRFRTRHPLANEVNYTDSKTSTASNSIPVVTSVTSKATTSKAEVSHSVPSAAPSAEDTSLLETTSHNYELRNDQQDMPLEGNVDIDPDFINENDDVLDDIMDSGSNSDSNDRTWNLPGSGQGGKRGRFPLSIWQKFDHRILPNGKKVVRCRTCKVEVSPVAKRLERHYEKCCLGYSRRSSSGNETVSAPRRGVRPRGTVWTHFIKTATPDGRIIVNCKYCHSKVSHHSTRMSRHLQSCAKSPISSEFNTGTSFDATMVERHGEEGDC